jgi:hypothetical protein
MAIQYFMNNNIIHLISINDQHLIDINNDIPDLIEVDDNRFHLVETEDDPDFIYIFQNNMYFSLLSSVSILSSVLLITSVYIFT